MAKKTRWTAGELAILDSIVKENQGLPRSELSRIAARSLPGRNTTAINKRLWYNEVSKRAGRGSYTPKYSQVAKVEPPEAKLGQLALLAQTIAEDAKRAGDLVLEQADVLYKIADAAGKLSRELTPIERWVTETLMLREMVRGVTYFVDRQGLVHRANGDRTTEEQ